LLIGGAVHTMSRFPSRAPRTRPRRGFSATAAAVALALVTLSPVPTAAQQVRGVVTEEGSALPLGGVLVTLVPPEGDSVHAATLTDVTGAFRLAASPGRWRIRSEQIGYRTTYSPPFLLQSGREAVVDLVVPTEAVPLAGLDVTVGRRCTLEPDDRTGVATVWEAARKALSLSRWGGEVEISRFEADVWERTLDPASLEVRTERRERRSSTGARPFESASPEELAERGFVQRTDSGTYYFGLDERVLLSDVFLDGHCFGLESPEPGSSLVGLTFEPLARTNRVDVKGVLWVDEETGELRRLEYSYVNLALDVDTRGLGGRVYFQRLPTGAWISRRWWIRMPVIEETRTRIPVRGRDVRRVELTGLLERGGEVLSVVTHDGGRISQLDRPRVQGVVWDSLAARPLSGAEVFLAGTGYRDVTDEHGHFLIVASQGDFQLSFRHPLLDTLGLEPAPRTVAMRPGVVRQARLSVPARETLLAAECSERGPVLVVGTVRSRGGRPLAGAEVRLAWRGARDRLERRQVRAGARGSFTFCDAPARTTLWARALLLGATSEPVAWTGEAGDVLSADLVIDTLRTGNLVGRVTDLVTGAPVVQAAVRLPGTELEGWTDGDGRFALADVPAGRRSLEVSHLLYGSKTDALRVRADSTVTLAVTLAAEAIELEPITVTVRQYRTPGQAAFHERMARGMGRFVTAEDIERQQAYRVIDILRRVPGLGVTCGTPSVLGSGCIIEFERARSLDARGRPRTCPVQYFLDGSPISQEILEALRPESIEGIEIYNGLSEVPPRLRRGPDTRCGVIGVWLKSRR
jgi:hypothetical protein